MTYFIPSRENIDRYGYDPREDYVEDYGANDEFWDE